MRLITPPSTPSAPAPEPVWEFRPATSFTPFEITCQTCQAVALVENESELHYRSHIIFYAGDVTMYLSAICPASDGQHWMNIEEYGCHIGSPRHAIPTRRWNEKIPMSARISAWRRWESSRTLEYWEAFFTTRDVQFWSVANPEISKKIQSRLRPGQPPLMPRWL